MLRKIIQAAYLNPQWRAHLVPLIDLGEFHRKRIASGPMSLRSAVIRTAFEVEDAKLRSTLVNIVAAHDRGATGLDADEATRLLAIGRQTKSSTVRRRIASLLRSAKYDPAFLRWVEKQHFRNPDTNNEVGFHSLPVAEQKKIHEHWKAGKKDWAQRHKPKGLSKETRVTPENFDDVKEGDLLWISWSPKKLHKVVGRSNTKGGKAMLDLVQVDPEDPSKEGERRVLHRSTIDKGEHEVHTMPKDQPAEEPKADEPEAPKAEPDEKPEAAKEPEAPKAEPEKAEPEKAEHEPPKGKHKDRKELRGRSKKKHDDKVKISDNLRALMLPKGLKDEFRKQVEGQIEDASYHLLGIAHENFQRALEKPDGKIARSMARQGYTPEDIQKVHKALESKLDELKGRRYSKTVLDIANKHDLEGEDADELYAFKHDRPHRGRKLPPQELMQKFLQKASPETRERMKGMPIADFMAMYNAIMADEDEESAAA